MTVIDRRNFLAAACAVGCGPGAFAQASGRVFTPEMFGAKGDGRTNDSQAMARLSNAVNAKGGGTIVFRRTTYIVGLQFHRPGGFYVYEPMDLLKLVDCTLPVHIQGNGARLLCAPGMRYGAFDPAGERAVNHPMPYLGPNIASPYRAMIAIEGSTGDVRVSDLEFAGATPSLIVGGQYGDTGWQIPSTGLMLINNRGAEIVERVHTHDHAQDGMLIDGVDAPPGGAVRRLSDVRADRNGRQGLSFVGGRGYRFQRCRFTRTGRGRVSSAPGAGVDIEAEQGKKVRDLVFEACRFEDNAGCGMVADTGDSAGVRFVDCTFAGTTSWSAWPAKPLFRFDRCTFVGALVRAHGDADPARAARFVQCHLTDDPALSPTRVVYGGVNTDRPLADLSDSRNMLFDRCTFEARHGGVLPWSTGAIYRDCTMTQGMTKAGFPRGQYVGTNRIVGRVDLYGSRISGTLTINGRIVR